MNKPIIRRWTVTYPAQSAVVAEHNCLVDELERLQSEIKQLNRRIIELEYRMSYFKRF